MTAGVTLQVGSSRRRAGKDAFFVSILNSENKAGVGSLSDYPCQRKLVASREFTSVTNGEEKNLTQNKQLTPVTNGEEKMKPKTVDFSHKW